MADLCRQIAEMQMAATTNAAALLASEAAKEELQAKVDTIPKSAAAYMRPEILAPVSPVVLPNIRARHFELKTSFLAMLKANAYSGNPTNTDECPLIHSKLFTDLYDTISSEEVPDE